MHFPPPLMFQNCRIELLKMYKKEKKFKKIFTLHFVIAKSVLKCVQEGEESKKVKYVSLKRKCQWQKKSENKNKHKHAKKWTLRRTRKKTRTKKTLTFFQSSNYHSTVTLQFANRNMNFRGKMLTSKKSKLQGCHKTKWKQDFIIIYRVLKEVF